MLLATFAAAGDAARACLLEADHRVATVAAGTEKPLLLDLVAAVDALWPVARAVHETPQLRVYSQPKLALPFRGLGEIHTPSVRLAWLFWLHRATGAVLADPAASTQRMTHTLLGYLDAAEPLAAAVAQPVFEKPANTRRVREAVAALLDPRARQESRRQLLWVYTTQMLGSVELPPPVLFAFWRDLYHQLRAEPPGAPRALALAAFARFALQHTSEAMARNRGWYVQFLPAPEREVALEQLSIPVGQRPNNQPPKEMLESRRPTAKLYKPMQRPGAVPLVA
jgi:hypothetical protein